MRTRGAVLCVAVLLSGCTIDREAARPETSTVVVLEEYSSVPSSTGASTSEPAPIPADINVTGGEFGAVLFDGTSEDTFGTLQSDVAWSTIKVPIALTAAAQGTADSSLVAAALRQSDNAAALSLWQSLGTDAQAARLVEQQIAVVATAPNVNDVRKRPEFSVFGQTEWSLSSQAEFGYRLECHPNAAVVTDDMAQVAPDQRYGLGRIPGMRFKGGWGPDPAGGYMARQFGFVETERGRFGVAIAAKPVDGTYASAQVMLDSIAAQIQERMVAGGALVCS